MTFIGIDPGLSGGIAILGTDHWDVELYRFNGYSGDWLPHGIGPGATAAIEMVSINPAWRNSNAGKLLENAGWWLGLLTAHGVPTIRVHPRTWQSAMGVYQWDKQQMLQEAKKIFPGHSGITLATADALLIAEWLRIRHQQENGAKRLNGSARN